MSYLDSTRDNSRRSKAIIGVATIHALMGYVLVTGLGQQVFDKARGSFIAVQIPIDDPVPPPPTPTPTDQPPDTAYVDPVAPKPKFEVADNTTITIRDFDPVDVSDDLVLKIPPHADPGPALPSPTPSLFTPKFASPRNGPIGWISTADYPGSALRLGAEGTSRYRLVIGTNGRVSACEITATAGNQALDDAACKWISRRARFDPATNEHGAEVVGTYTGSVTWQIPD